MPTTTCYITGVPHAKPDLSKLTIGTEVNLVAEPHNAYDPNAVMVMFNGQKLGYIPKTMTQLVHIGGLTKAKIVAFSATKWHEIQIEF